MKPSSDLFDLIRSMTMAEKKYFKLWASAHAKKEKDDYVKLFDAVAAQKKYDEKAVRALFAGKGPSRHLARKKYYLYHALLKSMQAYRSEMTVNARIRLLYDGAEYLAEKGLWRQAKKLLQKAEKMCGKYEQFPLLLETGSLKRKIILQQTYTDPLQAEKEMQEHDSITLTALDKFRNMHEYWKINLQLYILQGGSFKVRDALQKKKYGSIAKSPLLQDKRQALSRQALYYYYQALGLHAHLNGDHAASYDYKKQNFTLFESTPEAKTREMAGRYINMLRNMIIDLTSMREYPAAAQHLNKLRSFKTSVPALKTDIFRSHSLLYLELLADTGKFEEGIRFIDEIEHVLPQHLPVIHNTGDVASLYFRCAHVCIGVERFKESLSWLNRFFSEIGQEIRPDIHAFVRILNLIVHYELENTDLLPYVTRSTYRFLLKHERLYKVESVILDFIRKKVPVSNSRASRMGAFRALKEELAPLANDPYEKTAFDYFDFISWLESKISGRPFGEVVREKAIRTEESR